MKLAEAAKKGITRLAYVQNGRSVWNEYSFADIDVFEDGTYGPWMHVYDPCGQLACGNEAWKPIELLTITVKSQPSVDTENDEFEPYAPPPDMNRFPGCPPVKSIIKAPKTVSLKMGPV